MSRPESATDFLAPVRAFPEGNRGSAGASFLHIFPCAMRPKLAEKPMASTDSQSALLEAKRVLRRFKEGGNGEALRLSPGKNGDMPERLADVFNDLLREVAEERDAT